MVKGHNACNLHLNYSEKNLYTHIYMCASNVYVYMYISVYVYINMYVKHSIYLKRE